jgi:diguanylate cyclase (GGDEF)-like protein
MCLTHSPGSLAMLALTGIVPFSIFFMTLGNQVLFVIAINMLIVSAAIAVVVFGYSRDFSERVHVQQNLIDRQAETQRLSQDNDRLANIDSLTGLPNRRSFLKQLEDGLTTARHGSQKLAVGLIDLDGFKPVNDVYGHAYGDQLLNLVGQRLRRCHGERVSFARLGGDEFGILFRDPSGVEDVVNCGRSISEALRCPFDLSPIRIQISGSVGFAVFPDAAQSPEKLFEKADYALYHAKNSARGSVVLFSEEHERAIAREGLIVQNLMSADLETELSLAFQPIIDTRTGQPLGFEALARWESPLLGNVPPSVFVELAERHNMINQLTLVLLRKALCAAREWPDNFFVSFNLSAFDLASPAAMVKILETIRGAGFPASRIDFEITETAVVVDFEQARRAIIALRELGARIALDDFGCGYSSLAYVQKLPIDRIKIDRSFVSEIEKDPASQKIVRTIVVLCRNLEIDCVAEGVETDGQLKALQSADCHNVQGYLFAKPMPSREISPYLMNQLATKIKPITSGKAAAA